MLLISVVPRRWFILACFYVGISFWRPFCLLCFSSFDCLVSLFKWLLYCLVIYRFWPLGHPQLHLVSAARFLFLGFQVLVLAVVEFHWVLGCWRRELQKGEALCWGSASFWIRNLWSWRQQLEAFLGKTGELFCWFCSMLLGNLVVGAGGGSASSCLLLGKCCCFFWTMSWS